MKLNRLGVVLELLRPVTWCAESIQSTAVQRCPRTRDEATQGASLENGARRANRCSKRPAELYPSTGAGPRKSRHRAVAPRMILSKTRSRICASAKTVINAPLESADPRQAAGFPPRASPCAIPTPAEQAEAACARECVHRDPRSRLGGKAARSRASDGGSPKYPRFPWSQADLA